jgi:hypothetical protein
MGQQGLIFVYLPILCLLSAWGSNASIRRWRWGKALVTICVAGNVLLYLFAPAYLPPNQFKVLSQATIREQDTLIQAEVESVRSDLPRDAVLVSNEWRFPQYYLPDVPLVPYRHSDENGVAEVPNLNEADMEKIEAATTLAWYEPVIDQYILTQGRTSLLDDHHGVRLRVLRRTANERFHITTDGISIQQRTP